MKTKREMRQEAIKRLNETEPFANGFNCYKYGIEGALVDVFADIEVEDVRKCIIDLLSDDDEDMSDYIKLPRDANGEVIHIGDEMVVGDYRYIVDGVGLADRTDVFFVTDGDKTECFPAKVCRHCRLPTIEDVLREFADKVTDSQVPGTHPTYEEAIAEYAKKLQLKEVQECE